MDKEDILCHVSLMQRSNTKSRIQRLDLISAKLKTDEPLTIGDLAKEFGVSSRTLSRDIQLLKEQGLPIDSENGRGGGVRLDKHWGIGRVNLNYAEAVDLLISLAVAEQMESPLFMAHLSGIRHKLMASFSPQLKGKVNSLKSRILIAGAASQSVMAKFKSPNRQIVNILHQAFLVQSQIKMEYLSLQNEKTVRIIEPHYLLLSYPVWYIIAWDHHRNDCRTFRCDRVSEMELLEIFFPVLPTFRFKNSLEGIETK